MKLKKELRDLNSGEKILIEDRNGEILIGYVVGRFLDYGSSIWTAKTSIGEIKFHRRQVLATFRKKAPPAVANRSVEESKFKNPVYEWAYWSNVNECWMTHPSLLTEDAFKKIYDSYIYRIHAGPFEGRVQP